MRDIADIATRAINRLNRWGDSVTFRLAPTLITPTPSRPSIPSTSPPSLKAASLRRRPLFRTFVFAALTLIVFGIVLKFGWTTPAISPADTRMTEQLQNILDLVRDQRWTTARQAIETYEKSALSDSERQQAADVRTRFEKSARTRVEQALATAVELVGAGRITDARLVLEQAKEPAAACGWNDRLATALSKLPTP